MIVNIVKVSLRGILANKMRSLLTMLGVIIGVAAIIAMLSLAEGARREVTESISKMGTNLLRVRPGAAQVGHVAVGFAETLTMDDAIAIGEAVPRIRALSPSMGGQGQIKYAAKNAATLITGTTPEFMDINNFVLQEGRFIEPMDVKLMRKAAVLGATVKKDLFGQGIAVGEYIRVEGQSFLVVGVMEPKGQTSWRDPDDQIFVPITTFGKRLFDQDHLSDIFVQVENTADIEGVKEGVHSLLKQRHRTQEGEEPDFNIRDYTEFVATLEETARTFTVLLGGTAAVSLLVGGIGVMNIMLVSVTERTREIGIRMAVGARRRDILRQFLIEALVVTVTGGLMGIALGVLLSKGISSWGGWGETAVTPWSVMLAFFFSGLVGVIFGLYPAIKASRMDPIEALRYE